MMVLSYISATKALMISGGLLNNGLFHFISVHGDGHKILGGLLVRISRGSRERCDIFIGGAKIPCKISKGSVQSS